MAKTKKQTAPTIDSISTAKLNIPSMIRPKTAPVAAPPRTGAAMLAKLASLRKTIVGDDGKKATKQRPTLDLPVDSQRLFQQHILAAELSDHFSSHSENLKAALKVDLMPLYIAQMWGARSQPANPTLKVSKTITDPITLHTKQVPDLEGMFVVVERMTVQATTAEELVAMLEEVGLTEANALKLVAENVDFTPNTSINFNVLMNGKYIDGKFVESSPEEKVIAEKALGLLMGTSKEKLSDEELALLIDTNDLIKVKKGFLERVCSYIEVSGPDSDATGMKILTAVLTLIKPTLNAGRYKFGISDTLVEKNDRLLEGAREIIGIQSGE